MLAAEKNDYWSDARRPLSSLLFLLPLIAIYEAGVIMLGDSNPDRLRNGADYWLRALLAAVGLGGQLLLLPLAVVGILAAWHLVRRHPWRVAPVTLAGMLAESIVLAAILVVIGQLHQLLFLAVSSEQPSHLLALSTGGLTEAVGFIGAGVYEEVMFRLLLVPVVFAGFRVFEFPPKWAAVMAAGSTAFVFALAHHIGPNADAFNFFTFSFRAAAGGFFAAVFLLRGFGITVGCHAAYDLMVGILLSAPVDSGPQ